MQWAYSGEVDSTLFQTPSGRGDLRATQKRSPKVESAIIGGCSGATVLVQYFGLDRGEGKKKKGETSHRLKKQPGFAGRRVKSIQYEYVPSTTSSRVFVCSSHHSILPGYSPVCRWLQLAATWQAVRTNQQTEARSDKVGFSFPKAILSSLLFKLFLHFIGAIPAHHSHPPHFYVLQYHSASLEPVVNIPNDIRMPDHTTVRPRNAPPAETWPDMGHTHHTTPRLEQAKRNRVSPLFPPASGNLNLPSPGTPHGAFLAAQVQRRPQPECASSSCVTSSTSRSDGVHRLEHQPTQRFTLCRILHSWLTLEPSRSFNLASGPHFTGSNVFCLRVLVRVGWGRENPTSSNFLDNPTHLFGVPRINVGCCRIPSLLVSPFTCLQLLFGLPIPRLGVPLVVNLCASSSYSSPE
jgi:hypothetical protein